MNTYTRDSSEFHPPRSDSQMFSVSSRKKISLLSWFCSHKSWKWFSEGSRLLVLASGLVLSFSFQRKIASFSSNLLCIYSRKKDRLGESALLDRRLDEDTCAALKTSPMEPTLTWFKRLKLCLYCSKSTIQGEIMFSSVCKIHPTWIDWDKKLHFPFGSIYFSLSGGDFSPSPDKCGLKWERKKKLEFSFLKWTWIITRAIWKWKWSQMELIWRCSSLIGAKSLTNIQIRTNLKLERLVKDYPDPEGWLISE